MKKIQKINTNLDDYTEDEFYKGGKLIVSLTGTNILLFPGLPIPPPDIKTLIGKFDDFRTSPNYKGKGADVAASRTAVQTALTTNGTWLNNFCKGDLTLLEKTGYPLEKEGEAQGKLDASILTLSEGDVAGSIGFFISHVEGRGLKYALRYTLATNAETNPALWEGFFYAAGQREGVIPGLTSKVDYKYASVAMGTSRDLTYSAPVIKSAQ